MNLGVAAAIVLWETALSLLGCTSAFMSTSYSEDAALMRHRNQEWGARGDYCRDVFEKRVEHWRLPQLIVELRHECSSSNGAACFDLARATRGGCGDMQVDETQAYLLAKSSCDLGAIEGCRTYVAWCSAWSAKACNPTYVDDARRRIDMSPRAGANP